MKFDVTSTALGRVVFSRLDQTSETAAVNSSRMARLTGIDPADLVVDVAADQTVSAALDRYGEEWHVDSDVVAMAAPLPGYPHPRNAKPRLRAGAE